VYHMLLSSSSYIHTYIYNAIMRLLLDKNIGAIQISHITAKLKLDKMVTW